MSLPWAWVALLLGAVAAGAAVVALLVAPPRLEAVSLVAAGVGAGGSAWGLSVVARTLAAPAPTLIAAALGLAGAAGGYWLAASMLPLLARPRPVAPLVPTDDLNDRPAYVLLSRAEPESYRPSGAASLAVEASEPGSLFVPSAILPFLFATNKARYRMTHGRSPARETVRGIAQRVTRALRVPEVHVAWCEPPTDLAATVRSLAEAGHRRIVVGVAGVAEGRPEERARRCLAGLRLEESRIRVIFAEPLWASESVAKLVARRVEAFAEGDPAAGVVLALEAQPPAWERAHPEFDTQVAAFGGRVAALIAQDGVPESNVRTGWTEWRSPDVTEAVRHLASLGCERVGVVPTVSATETLSTMLDLGRAATLARTEAEVQLLPPWGNDEVVALALVDAMRRAAHEPENG